MPLSIEQGLKFRGKIQAALKALDVAHCSRAGRLPHCLVGFD